MVFRAKRCLVQTEEHANTVVCSIHREATEGHMLMEITAFAWGLEDPSPYLGAHLPLAASSVYLHSHTV